MGSAEVGGSRAGRLPQLLIFPIVPWTMGRVDPRLMVGFGIVLFAISSS